MEYGKYKINLSIGYHGADREDELDLADYYELAEWNSMSESDRENAFVEIQKEILGQYIEYEFELIKPS